MFKASTVYWCNIPVEKPGSRNCGTGKVIKVESSKMQERHDEAWKNWRTARKSRSVFEILRSVVLKCFNETHAWFDLQLNFPSLCKLPRLKLYKIHIHDGSFLCDFTRFLLEIQSRTCFSSWLHPSFQQNKYTKHIQNNLWQAQHHPWTNFWGPEHDLMLKECPCAARAKLFQWRATGKREALALGQESQSCRIIHCLPFLYLACILRFFCSPWACPNSHTHTHMRSVFEGLFASAFAGPVKKLQNS